MWTRFIDLAGEVNARMPSWVLLKTVEPLNAAGKSIKGARILVLGLSYKADIDDDRESPSYEIIELLREQGAEVSYCDPYFPRARAVRKHDIGLESVPLTAEEFGRYDAVLLATDHREFADPAPYRDTTPVIYTREVVDPAWGPEVVWERAS